MEGKPLSQTFNESAAALYKAFPEQLESLVVLITPLEQPVYISPDIAEHLSKNPEAVKRAVIERTNHIYFNNTKGVANNSYPLAGKTVKMIALEENLSGSSSPRYTEEMKLLLIFDHEMGHLVVKNGYSADDHLAECAADAYMALRHIQRFGRDTDFFENFNRAYSVIRKQNPIHYTNTVTQKVKQLSEERDISALSLRETAALAAKIAEEYRLSPRTLEKISAAFETARNLYAWDGWCGNVLKECFNIMHKNKNDPDIYQTGKQILSVPDLKKHIDGNDPLWQEAFGWMAQHEKESGIILDPVKLADAKRLSAATTPSKPVTGR